MSSIIRLSEPAIDLLEQLERRHEEVLTMIDELTEKIDATLAQHRPAKLEAS